MKHRSPEPTSKEERPDFDKTPLIQITPSRAASLKPIISTLTTPNIPQGRNEIPDGEPCKNGGCKQVRLVYL